MATLESLGFGPWFDAQVRPEELAGHAVARVVEEQKRFYFVEHEAGVELVRIAGRLRHQASGRGDLPAVGDFVLLERPGEGGARIVRVLPRRTKLSRKTAGREGEEQILAANVDLAILVHAADDVLNERRMERLLAVVHQGGATPVVALTKIDLADPAAAREPLTRLAPDVPVFEVGAHSGAGLPALAALLAPGLTAVLLGPSGVGKSTLVNALAGAPVRVVAEVRVDDRKGRHTTTARTLVRLPGGALVIDTPGIRELALWGDDQGVAETFDAVEAIAARCRFRDCQHDREPGCAVRAALDAGTLPPERYEAFRKLSAEVSAQERRTSARARAEESRRGRVMSRALRDRLKDKGRGD